MSEETEKLLVKTLMELKGVVTSNQTDYCNSKEAALKIGLIETRHLKTLNEMNVLPKYERAGKIIYKKSDCYKVAAMLDNKSVVLKARKK